MSLFDFQMNKLIKKLETLDYDALIIGLEQLKGQYVDKDDRYYKAIFAIQQCMKELKGIYKEEE